MIQSPQELRQELVRIAGAPNGLSRLSLIMRIEDIPFGMPRTAALMIDAILEHDDAKWCQSHIHASAQSVPPLEPA